MKYALIGCGRISPNHIEAAKNNGLDIVALCDIVPSLMDEKAKRFGLEHVHQYTDYQELLKNEKPDLAAIATESGNHAAIALDCIDHGCHVIIEKPIALSIKDADAIIKAGHEKGVVVCANHQNRFNKSVQYIRKALDDGRFGKLSHGAAHVRWNRGKGYYEQAPWRGTWAQDGGCLMNQCIHNIDLLRWMMGDEIVEVMAYTDQVEHPYLEAEDLGLAIIKFANGSYGLVEGTTNVYPKNLEETLYIFGQNGTVKVGGTSDNIIEVWSFADGKDDPDDVMRTYSDNPPNVYGFGHTPLYADVIDAIQNNREPYVTGEAGKSALELVLAIYQSAAEHRPVSLPLKECSTMDFAGRFDEKKDGKHE
ncbi:MAG: Gfo/Idh/MocA family oxidoreductase [Ruminococcus sp.]|nr:Gfo/Idh/MocA family oxidoreductase [Ruminococcus sp.]